MIVIENYWEELVMASIYEYIHMNILSLTSTSFKCADYEKHK